MKRPLPQPPLKPRSLPTTRLKAKTVAQQGTDFTAEGAPPPGKVGAGEPMDSAQQAQLKYEATRQVRAKRG